MADEASFTVDGLPEVQALLEQLPGAIRRDALADAIRPAGEMVRDAIKGAANFGRYSTGKLKESIVFRPTTLGGQPSGVVTPNRKKGGGGKHAHLVEFGVAPHMEPRKKGGPMVIPHPGMGAEAFFWPAAQAASESALDVMERLVAERVDAYWASQGAASSGSGGSAGDAGGEDA